MNQFIPVAFAQNQQAGSETQATVQQPEKAQSQGLSVDPGVIGFQALNFAVLLIALNLILYKPLTKLLREREKKIREGVENAEKAEVSLREATSIREGMLKSAKVESQNMLDQARKEGETLKNGIVLEAQDQAKKIIDNGYQMIDAEKDKTMEALKAQAVQLIMKTTEKVLRQKMDASQDAKMIEEHLQTYSA